MIGHKMRAVIQVQGSNAPSVKNLSLEKCCSSRYEELIKSPALQGVFLDTGGKAELRQEQELPRACFRERVVSPPAISLVL